MFDHHPSRTTIIGNFEFDYRNKKIDLSQESWMKKLFRAAHTKMDIDPAVWALVEELIVKEINGHKSGADGRTFKAANDGHRRIHRR